MRLRAPHIAASLLFFLATQPQLRICNQVSSHSLTAIVDDTDNLDKQPIGPRSFPMTSNYVTSLRHAARYQPVVSRQRAVYCVISWRAAQSSCRKRWCVGCKVDRRRHHCHRNSGSGEQSQVSRHRFKGSSVARHVGPADLQSVCGLEHLRSREREHHERIPHK